MFVDVFRFFHRVSAMVFELPFNRDMETEADEVGLQVRIF
jgi:hypothetical protein